MFLSNKEKESTTLPKKIDNQDGIFNLPNVRKISGEDATKNNPITPITFTTKGECICEGLIDYPIKCSMDINLDNIHSKELFPGPNSDDNFNSLLMNSLDWNNARLMRYQLSTYIVQTAFTNFCSAFTSSEHAYLSNYIPILEFVREEIDNESKRYIDSIILDINNRNVYCSLNIYSGKGMRDKEIYLTQCALLFAQSVCSSMSFGADKAINDIIYQVHVIPNIKELYKRLADESDFIRNIKGTADFQTYTAMYIKAILKDIIDISMTSTIHSIKKILTELHLDPFYAYRDAKLDESMHRYMKSGHSFEESVEVFVNCNYCDDECE